MRTFLPLFLAVLMVLSFPLTAQVGHWKLDNNYTDSSPNNISGTLIGSPSFSADRKEGTHALQTTPTQAIDLGTPASFPTGNAPRTIAAWAKTNTTSGSRMIAAFGTPNAGQAMFIGQEGSALVGGGWSLGYNIMSEGFWTVDTWHHICLTYDGSTARLYADGVLIGSMTKAYNLVMSGAFIGKHLHVSGWWNGSIDDVRVYDQALSISEIRELAGIAPTIPNAPSGLNATALSHSQIELSWSDNASDEIGVEISRSEMPETGFVVVETTGMNSTSFTDSGLNGNTTYYYRIRAIGTAGSSDFTPVASATTGSPAGPVAHWRFDNDLSDDSGNSRSGTHVNGSSFSINSIQGSHSLSLNGSGQYVNVVNDAGLPSGTAPRTLSAWAMTNTTTGSGYRWAVAYGNDAPGEAMYIGLQGSDLKVGSYGATNTFHFGGAWTVGEWKHVCLTYDGSTAKVYINGVEAASQAMAWNLVIDDFFIGKQVNNTAEHWNGLIDDVRVYDRALTSAEVEQLASITPGIPAVPTNFGATAVSPSEIALSWLDNAPNEIGVEISRSELPDANFVVVGTAAANSTSFVDTGLTDNTTYYYRVRALGTVGDSDYTPTVSVTTGIPSGPVAHWRFDNDLSDASGNSRSGTHVNGSSFSTNSMQGSHSLSLNGSGQYVNVVNDAGLPSGMAPRTLSAWAMTNSTTGTGYRWVVAYGNDAPGQAMYIGLQGSDLKVGSYGAANTFHFGGAWTVGEWKHVCLTYDGSTAKVYINGVEAASQAMAWNLVIDDFFIGKQVNNTAEHWNGLIDDVRVYDRALTSAEIQQLADITPGVPAAPTNLSATAVSPSEIALSWLDNAPNEIGVEISRSELPDADFVIVGTAAANSTSFVDTGLTDNTTYYYRVRALGTVGDSDYSPTVSVTTGIPSGPVAHWRFDNDLSDASGNSRSGTHVNGSSFSINSIQGSHSLFLNGSGQYVNVVNDAGLPSGAAPRTLSAWAMTNTTAGSGYRWAVAYGNDAPGEAMYIGLQGSDLKVGSYGAANTFHFGGAWTVGEWKHVCLTYDGSTAKVYINGVESASQAMAWNLVIDDFFIGKQVNNTAEHWNGLIDDVRVYDRALSYSEVTALAQSSPALAVPTNLSVSVANATSVSLTWSDNSDDETGFEVSRSELPDDGFQTTHITNANATSYTDTGLQPETHYYYKIRAIAENRMSEYTAVVEAVTGSAYNSVPDEIEAQVLMDLYFALGGYSWLNNTNWPSFDNGPVPATSDEFSTWYGVTVENGDVVGLDLSFNYASGTLPESIGHLSSLQELNLARSSVVIPLEINQLKQLRVLNMAGSSFEGQFPDLSGLEALEYLSIYTTELSDNFDPGPLPTWIGNLTRLTYLRLENLERTGVIPESLYELSDLTYLDLSGNKFTGSLSSNISNLSLLETLDLGDNSLSGVIPSGIVQLNQLSNLNLAVNQFTGAIPNQIGGLPLVTLNVAQNNLTGSIPQSLTQHATLKVLNLSNNSLGGSIPAFGNLASLQFLGLGNNSLSGSLTFLEDLPDLTSFQVQRNHVSSVSGGEHLPKLNYVDASENELTSFPEFPNTEFLSHFNISGNPTLPSGLIPSWLQNSYWLSYIGLRNTNRTGGLPSDMIDRYGYYTTVDIAENGLTGSIPQNYLIAVEHLDLSYNNLTGEVPSPGYSSSSIRTLILNNNQLTGSLPTAEFWYLDVSHNNFTGDLSSSFFDQLYFAYHIDISHNKLAGPLPDNIGDIALNWTPNGYIRKTAKIYLDFGHNHFTSIPESIWEITEFNRAEEYEFHFDNNLLSAFPVPGSTTTNVSLDISRNFITIEDRTELVSQQRIDEVTTEPQRDNFDPFTVEGSAGQPLTIPGPGLSDFQLTWEKKSETGNWQVASSLNDDASHATFRRNEFASGDKGVYRWVIEGLQGLLFVRSGDITVIDQSRSVLDNFAFQYRYDARRRMIAKKMPGADWVYMVYDNRDRLVMTQDGNQRNHKDELDNPSPQWTWTKYDHLNRPIMTGIYTHNAELTQKEMSDLISTTVFYETRTSDESGHGYTNNVFHAQEFITGNFEVLTVTYYDDDSYAALIKTAAGTEDTRFRYSPCEIENQYAYAGTDCTNKISFPRLKGMVTATKTRVLGVASPAWLWSVNHYDDKGRVVQTVSTNALEGIDRVTSEYDFVGKVMYRKTVHKTADFIGGHHIVERDFDYDHAGRLERIKHSIGGNDNFVILCENQYNELGQLVTKKLHSEDDGASFKQEVDYQYNIRGWLTKVNDPAIIGSDLFGMELKYNSPTMQDIDAQFNGNISQIDWRSTDREEQQYGYSYDPMNRLLEAKYFNQTSPGKTNRFNEKIRNNASSHSAQAYDLNGNILGIIRQGQTGPDAAGAMTYGDMDEIRFVYKGNQLLRVDELLENDLNGFTDGENAGDDYQYDPNGNLTTDENKTIGGVDTPTGISQITYNHLNLPHVVRNDSGEYVEYIYDANGIKRAQALYDSDGNLMKGSFYEGEFFYELEVENAIEPVFIHTEEGRVVMTGSTPEYQYHLKDHLGNVRVTFTSKEETVAAVATMEAENASEESGEFLYYDEAVRVHSDLFDHTAESLVPPGTPPTPLPPDGDPDTMDKWVSTRLSGYPHEQYGLAKSLSVQPGDIVRIEVFAKYIDPNQENWQTPLIDVLTAIGDPTSGVLLDGGAPGSIGTETFPNGMVLSKSGGGTVPKAYLNYISFDADNNPILSDPSQTNYVPLTEAAKESGLNVSHERLFAEIHVKRAGLMYIYLSNDNVALGGQPVDVFFDDFKVEHVHSSVVQSDDYYPFGLTFNSYKRENSLPNMFQYNGKEKQDELNLEWLDYGARMYMPEVARWGVLDALADRYEGISPYAYTLNDPVNAVDPDGNLIIFVNGFMKNQWSSSDNQKYVTYKMRGERDIVENPNYRPYPGERSFNRNAPTYLNQPFRYWGNEAIAGRSFSPHGGVGGLFSQIYDDKNSLFISASADNNSQASDRFAEGIKAADDLISKLDNGDVQLGADETIKIIGHSQGAAFAAGMVSVLAKHAKYSSRLEVVHYLSPHQPESFEHAAGVDAYQWSTESDLVSSVGAGNLLLQMLSGYSTYAKIRGVSDGRFMGRKYHKSGMGGHYAETWVRDIVKWATDNGIKITVWH